jgi:hypothetical protein
MKPLKGIKGISFQKRDEKKISKSSSLPVSIQRITPVSSGYCYSSETEIPDVIEASYVNDFNLIYIHDVIIRKLRAEYGFIPSLKAELDKELKIIKQPQTILERRNSMDKIRNLKKKIEDIQEGKRMREYMDKAEPLMKKYESMVPTMRKINFQSTEKERTEALQKEEYDPEYIKKMEVIRKYLDIAQKYINIRVIQKKKNVNFCACGYDLNDVHIDNFGTQICPSCGNERYIIGYNLCRRDTLSSRNDYSDRDNFEKALRRYQGKQVDKIPGTLFRDLDEYFSSRGMAVGDEVKERDFDSRGRKRGTELPMLYKALQETGYSSLYEDANLIAHRYWGWKLPDVSHLEPIIMNDYEATQKVYNTLPKDRSSSLGTQFRLFKHLQLRGHHCTIDDFKIVKMRSSLEFHDETWRQMCDKCENPEIYFIPTI